MKVVLRVDVEGLGRKGDICEVNSGYARNYLMPKGLALKSSPGAVRQAEAMRRSAALRRAEDRADAEAIGVRLAPTVLTVSARAAESGQLYGSVGPADLVAAVDEQAGATIDSSMVALEAPIREVGTHTVMFQLHEDVVVPVTVEVTAQA
ncbi:MAG: 50S ribosomal protein L9 [Acidimicrobiaceae bacterium]|nr:50S ribosomal protein L9 [Acidimicrobiaceae bacterium]MCY4176855.1 50S ribosomal protein L9 [Acidimicrobiaceae bacterium]MCY4279610.1 50S ribosomal protein L9 [Acidimicrobiaceae bacterium]MCY4293980.1 50S ribosomal protein L9 [Acidimicrobiaceae bacterium]